MNFPLGSAGRRNRKISHLSYFECYHYSKYFKRSNVTFVIWLCVVLSFVATLKGLPKIRLEQGDMCIKGAISNSNRENSVGVGSLEVENGLMKNMRK